MFLTKLMYDGISQEYIALDVDSFRLFPQNLFHLFLDTILPLLFLHVNYTCELLKQSGVFALSLLDQECSFETIKHFGFQSGRNVDKFDGIPAPRDCNDVPYMGWHSCAVISGKVVEQHDLGTHTLFIAEVVDAKLLNANAPLTYADYQNHVKPQPEAVKKDKKIIGWRCKICNYVYEGSELPKDFICPLCGHGVDDFEPIYE